MKRLRRFETIEHNPDCISGLGKSNNRPLPSLQTQATAAARPELAARTNGKLRPWWIVVHRQAI